jgi:RNA polymerase sigma-70 factor (ECF subfamily)
MNRAIALAETEGAQVALDELDGLQGLDGYHLFHATRADLLRRLRRDHEADDAYAAAIKRAKNAAARDFLRTRLRSPMTEP